jgi:seryl-tRNA synthetase
MLDIKFIRENPGIIKKACQNKQVKVDVDRLLEIDKKRRQALQGVEDMRAQKNKANKEIGQTKTEKEKKKIILKMQELDRNSDRLNKELKKLNEVFNALMLQIPNPALADSPIGRDDKDNVVLKEVGKKPKLSQLKSYLEIGEFMDLIDVKRAVKVAGSRFGYIKKEAALIEFALANLAFEILIKEKFIPIVPPVILKSEMARGMGYLEQADKEEAYYLPQDDLYLVGTSEQSIGTMHAGEIFEEKDLPKRYIAFSTCFRREAGSYGKDTKGILRVHQFDKLEMFSFVRPEDSVKEHNFFLKMEEKLMQELKLPYRVINICTGDLGRPAVAKYDIETWLPSEDCYRETHSASNCTDFQARRLNIRYKNKNNKLNFVHTVNGTAFAIGRMLIMIIENYQQKDGSILVPKALRKYLSFKKIGPVK